MLLMEALPDLDRLSVAEKDDLIRAIFAQVETLLSKVAELEGRLAKNSRNSSTPSLHGWVQAEAEIAAQSGPETHGRPEGAHRPHAEEGRGSGSH